MSYCLLKNSTYKKGVCFWYRIKKRIFGAVIIDIQLDSEANPLYLILISEELREMPKQINDVLSKKSYTLAWFDELSLLPPIRIHILGVLQITKEYRNMFGLSITHGAFICTNIGQAATWKHDYCALSFHGERISDVLRVRLKYSDIF